MRAERHSHGGFSLIEIAVVLLILGILATMVGIPLATQLEQQRTLDTQKLSETIKEAVYGFAMANGRLPCPASANSNGRESFCTADSPAACGAEIPGTYQPHGRCFNAVGFVPAATLALAPVDADGFAVDAWGLQQNRVRYAVSSRSVTAGTPTTCLASVANILSTSDGIKSATMGCLSDATMNLLTICGSTPTGSPGAVTACASLTTKAPFAIYSLGKNAPTGAVAGSDEAHNVDVDMYLVSRIPSTVDAVGGEFDDIVTWGSLNTLFARLVQAGKLP